MVTLASVLVTMAIQVCFDVSSAPQMKDVSLHFFSRFSLDAAHQTHSAVCFVCRTLWWPLTTRRLYVGSQLDPVLGIEEPGRQPAPATKSGAGDREAGPVAGGPRLCPVPEDRRAGDKTKAGSGAGESRNRSGSRWPAAGSEAVLRNRGAEAAAGGPRLDLRRWRIERPEPADSIAPSCRRQLTTQGAGLAVTEPCAGDWERSAESSAVPMTRLHPGLTTGRSQANKQGVMSV